MPGENSQKSKRANVISWDEWLMQLAYLIAKRSKDPNTQTGACIVDKNNLIVGLGYNGFPRGCSDDKFPWGRDGDFAEKKYAYVVHAEANAIYNSSRLPKGCKIYTTMFPCNECAKAIIQHGIQEVIYNLDPYHDDPIWVASRRMLKAAGVKCQKYELEYQLDLKKND